MNIYRALNYVQEHGDLLSRARAEALVQDRSPSPEVVAFLEGLQDADGGWPADLEAGRSSTVGETCTVLFALQELGLHGHPMARRGLQFLLARQEEDGGWADCPPEGRPQPRWLGRGEEAARLYLTAMVSSVLVTYGRAEEPAATRALDLLLRHQLEGGLFPGFPGHTSWYALPVLATRLGRRSGPAQNILRGLAQGLAEEGWVASMVAALLRNLLIAGYGLETQLVRTAWEQLVVRQEEDGSWASEEGAEGAGRSTLDVLWCWKRIVQRDHLPGG